MVQIRGRELRERERRDHHVVGARLGGAKELVNLVL